MSLNHLATRFACSWPWTTLVLSCDGRVVCGCADPYVQRVLGDARAQTLAEVWNAPAIRGLRADLNAGGSRFCGDCPLKLPLTDDAAPSVRPVDAGPLPSRLYIECTAACNISCFEACCAPETGITRTRQAGMLDYDLFTRVVDEAGPGLARIDFFNYGEAFLHKRAVEMCEYIKQRFPQTYLYTSTNGLALSEAQAVRLVHSGIDEVTFSIDGAFPESYARYRQRGRLDVALRTLRTMTEEKRRAGRDLPFLNWRYILFRWNDSADEMDRARALAEEIGVDRLTWRSPTIPNRPTRGASPRGRRGTTRFGARSGTTTTSATPSRAPPRAPASTCRRASRDCPCSTGAAVGSDSGPASTTCRAGRSRPGPPTAGGSCASAPNCVRPTARSPTATTRAPGSRPRFRPTTRPTWRSRSRCRTHRAATG